MNSGILIPRCTRLNVVLYWRRRTEETPPGAITFYVTAREFPTRPIARRRGTAVVAGVMSVR